MRSLTQSTEWKGENASVTKPLSSGCRTSSPTPSLKRRASETC